MMISPGLSRGIRVWICWVVASPAGTMIQTALGVLLQVVDKLLDREGWDGASAATSRVLSGERL